MNGLVGGFRYLLKAYLMGCVGCLGVWTTTIAVLAVVSFLAGPPLMQGAQEAVQGIKLPDLSSLPVGQGGPLGGSGQDRSSLTERRSANDGLPSSVPPYSMQGGFGQQPGVGTRTPGGSQSGSDCFKQIKMWLAKSETGPAVNEFGAVETIFVMAESSTDCGEVGARLLDERDRETQATMGAVRAGRGSLGKFNVDRRLSPGRYRVQFGLPGLVLNEVNVLLR